MNLNTTVDDLFRGVVFVVFDFVTTFFRLLVRPAAGLLLTIRRLRNPRESQIKPTVFLFLSIAFALVSPLVIQAASPDAVPHALPRSTTGLWSIPSDSVRSVLDLGGRANLILDLTISAMLGTAVYYLCVRVVAPLFLLRRAGRELLALFALYVAGVQFCCLPIAEALSAGLSEFASWTFPDLDMDILVWASVIPFVIFVLGVPIAAAWLLIDHQRPSRGRLRTLGLTGKILCAVGLVVALDVSFGASNVLVQNVFSDAQPLQYSSFHVRIADCSLVVHGSGAMATATIIVTTAADQPQLLNPMDFHLLVGRPGVRFGWLARQYAQPYRVSVSAMSDSATSQVLNPGSSVGITLTSYFERLPTAFTANADKRICAVQDDIHTVARYALD